MNKGLTLIEVVISLAILAIVSGAVMSSVLHTYRFIGAGKENSDTVQDLMNTLESGTPVNDVVQIDSSRDAVLSFRVNAYGVGVSEQTDISIPGKLHSSILSTGGSNPSQSDSILKQLEITEFIAN